MIPVYKPSLGAVDRQSLLEAFDSSWISSSGPFVDQFEDRLADETRFDYAATCSSGTAALHLALLALGVGPGDEVIIPDYTFVATANAVLYVGATPVYADVSPYSWCMDLSSVQRLTTARTKAIIFVSLYGSCAGLESIAEYGLRCGIPVIDDAAESLGTKKNGRPSQSLATLATLSFYGNKTITTGEGGAVLSSSEQLIGRVKSFRGHCQERQGEYVHSSLGYNYRLSNLLAAIGCAQLDSLQRVVERKIDIFNQYLKNGMAVFEYQACDESEYNSRWLAAFSYSSFKCEFGDLKKYCNQEGFDIRPGFQPMSTLPHLRKWSKENTPVSKSLSETVFCLPSYPDLEDTEIEFISQSILRFFK